MAKTALETVSRPQVLTETARAVLKGAAAFSALVAVLTASGVAAPVLARSVGSAIVRETVAVIIHPAIAVLVRPMPIVGQSVLGEPTPTVLEP